MDSQANFQRGCSLFVDEDYDAALLEFNQAIAADGNNEEYYIKRSICLHKLQRFTESLADANVAIKLNPNSAKAFMRKGLACFSLDEFETAKAAFTKGKSLDPQENGFQLWIRKCNAELDENENDISEVPTQRAEIATSQASSTPSVGQSTSTSAPTPIPTPTPAPAPVPSEPQSPQQPDENKPSVRHSWYQNDSFVCITFFVKDRTEKDVEITFGAKTLDVDIRLPDGGNYIFDVELCNEVNPSECKKILNKSNVEVKLKKVKPLQWGSLEYTGAASAPAAAPSNVKHVYPSSSKKKKNWDELASQVEEDKLEGEQALNKVFQDIFGKGSDEQRRAMMKSFVESGGTVLSTNWDEVGKGEVKGSPPKGMEAKKWNE